MIREVLLQKIQVVGIPQIAVEMPASDSPGGLLSEMSKG